LSKNYSDNDEMTQRSKTIFIHIFVKALKRACLAHVSVTIEKKEFKNKIKECRNDTKEPIWHRTGATRL
jgi:hypothetical protein